MRYNLYDLGTVREGHSVEIVLDRAANVRIMTKGNLTAFEEKLPHDYIGGYVKFAPYIVRIPSNERWYVVIDLGGREVKAKAVIRVHHGEKKREGKIIRLPEEKGLGTRG